MRFTSKMAAPDVQALFATLDAPFTKFEKKIEPIVWQGQDILVQNAFDLKIPAICGSTIKYSFSTTIGDINFASDFTTPGQSIEVVVEANRVPSDQEVIEGTFKTGRDGTFTLYFDNSYSWFNPKLLTYKVSLFQPEFTIADNSRVIMSRRLLANTMEETRRAEDTLEKAQERADIVDREAEVIEKRIQALTQELNSKRDILKAAHNEMFEMHKRIMYNLEKKNGLCIRSLDKKLLSIVLAYCGKASSVYYTCRYWKVCVDDFTRVKDISTAVVEGETNESSASSVAVMTK